MGQVVNALSEAVVTSLVDALAVPAFILTTDCTVLMSNAACDAVFDATLGGCLSSGHFQDLLIDDATGSNRDHLKQVLEGRSICSSAMFRLRDDEQTHIFVATTLQNENGDILGALCQCSNDIRRRDNVQMWQDLPDDMPRRRWLLDLHDGCIGPSEVALAPLPPVAPMSFRDHLRSVHPRDRQALNHAVVALISGIDDQIRLTYRVQTGLGGYTTVFGQGQISAQSPDGRPAAMTVTEVEVEGHIETADETISLAESEHRWKTGVVSSGHGLWDHDLERGRFFFSKAWRRLRGLGSKDAVPLTTADWLATIHQNDVGDVTDNLRRLEAGETDVIDYKYRQSHADGKWIWILSRGRVVRRGTDGAPARVIGIDIDITDIKTVELESRRMAERLDVAMEVGGMGRWEYSVNEDRTFWDDRLLDMMGVTDGENYRSGDDWNQFVHPDDLDVVIAYSNECLEKGRDVEVNYRLIRADGQLRHIRSLAKFVDDGESGPRFFGVNIDVTEEVLRAQDVEDARARLEHDSRHDALTGLANRRRLDDVYSEYLATRGEMAGRMAVLHFDIDHFKQINDTMGHDAGDATLIHAAGILLRNAPSSALVSRVGGDEFVALLFDAPDDDILQQIARKIIDEMSRPYYYDSQECLIGTSIGIAVTDGQPTSGNNLFIEADMALYDAKKAGRGRFCFFNEEMKEKARRRKNSFDALLAGFDQGEITCHYQPQFNAETLELTGLEALVRWESARYGLIAPSEFLQTAEDMGLLANFDELVLRRTLHDMAEWEKSGLRIPSISVNVSANRLNDPSLGDRLKELELPKGVLSFELLESAFLDAHNDIISKNLTMIRRLGIDIEVDDFGSGHASIASLLQVAPKRLKIDQNLILPIVESERQRELVKTIIGIGQMLDIGVVAEGVETAAHVSVLRDLGCCSLQGYGLCRPLSADAMAEFLATLTGTDGRLKLA